MSDAINKPAHYNQGSIECIEAMKIVLTPEEFRGYLKGNVFKYLWREKDKNGNEDLRKGKSYYDSLIELVDESEQQKAADLQSLKDHPFGKLRQPAWAPKVGDWVRIKNIDPREAWMPEMDKYDGKIVQVEEFDGRSIVHDEWCFLFDWLEPAEQPKASGHFDDTEGTWVEEKSPFDGRRNSDTIPEGYRKLKDSSIEPRQLGDLRWSVSRKRYVEISVDEIGYANRDNWAACRRQLAACQKVEPVIKQSLTTEPPDGWRWLERGELIRNGDKPVKGNAIPLLWVGTPCVNNHFMLRRNRFEVGEKVVHGFGDRQSISVVENILGDGWVDLVRDGVSTAYHVKDLAPYIEETK